MLSVDSKGSTLDVSHLDMQADDNKNSDINNYNDNGMPSAQHVAGLKNI